MEVCTLLQTENHASTPPLCFLQAGCPSCRPTNDRLKKTAFDRTNPIYIPTRMQILVTIGLGVLELWEG